MLSAAAVASGSLARAAPEANEATFAPDEDHTASAGVRTPMVGKARSGSAARARKPARETPPTGSIAYLYPERPAC